MSLRETYLGSSQTSLMELYYFTKKSARLHKNEVFHLKLQETADLVTFTEEILKMKNFIFFAVRS